MKKRHSWNLLSVAIVLCSSPALAVTSSYSGESCRGYPGPTDAAHNLSEVSPGASGDHYGANTIICPIVRKVADGATAVSLTSVDVLAETSTNCTLVFGDPSETFADVYQASVATTTNPSSSSTVGLLYTDFLFDVSTDEPSYEAYGYTYLMCDGGVLGYTVVE